MDGGLLFRVLIERSDSHNQVGLNGPLCDQMRATLRAKMSEFSG